MTVNNFIAHKRRVSVNMQIKWRPWTDASLVICQFINHAAKANSVIHIVGEICQVTQTQTLHKWVAEMKVALKKKMLRECQQLLQ